MQREPVLVAAVDELVGGRRHRGQDAEPGVRVAALGHLDQAGRHGVPADAVESVAARDRVAADLVARPGGVDEAEHRPVGVQVADLGAGDLELMWAPAASLARIRSLTISVCA